MVLMPGLVVVVGCAMVMGGGRGCREEKEEETKAICLINKPNK